jgi:hypothetical protein
VFAFTEGQLSFSECALLDLLRNNWRRRPDVNRGELLQSESSPNLALLWPPKCAEAEDRNRDLVSAESVAGQWRRPD